MMQRIETLETKGEPNTIFIYDAQVKAGWSEDKKFAEDDARIEENNGAGIPEQPPREATLRRARGEGVGGGEEWRKRK